MPYTEEKYQVWSCPNYPQTVRSDTRTSRVLLAEDNTIDQINIRRLLENEGIEVRCVDSGREVVDEARLGNFDMILMDILMPEMDGFEATRKIREDEQATGSGVPIFALTSYSLKAIQGKCRSVGMNGYFSKPVSARDLRSICRLFHILPVTEDVYYGASGQVLPILDTEEALVDLGGVRALYHELVDMFVGQAPHTIATIVSLIRSGDTDGTKQFIHRLKLSAENIGARKLVHLCSHIQSSLNNGNLDDCEQWSLQLPIELELVLEKIHGNGEDGVC
jgi:two-component system sensor histidine kinase/response regulator